jgi:hypothetical protein
MHRRMIGRAVDSPRDPCAQSAVSANRAHRRRHQSREQDSSRLRSRSVPATNPAIDPRRPSGSPLSSKRPVPAVPCKSLHPIHALSTPVAVCPVIRHLSNFVPEAPHASGFDNVLVLNDASSKGSISFVSRLRTCSRYCLSLLLQPSHHHGLFAAAAWRDLRPAPESRSRGAHPRLLHSPTYLPPRLSLQHTRAQKHIACGAGSKSRILNRVKVDFIRLIVLVRCLAGHSRPRCGRLHPLSPTAGLR